MKKIYSIAKILGLTFILGSTGLQAQTYCSQAAGSTYDDEIFNVTLGTLNNTSNCSQTGGPGSLQNRYSDYTTVVPAPILMTGMNYPLSVVGGQCNGGSYCGNTYVWIDYNQNGSFTDPGELVWQAPYTCWAITGTTMVATGGITIPVTAIAGNTRMRVTLVEGSTSGPCASYSWGETEDYLVTIIPPVPCSGAPSANAVVTPTYEICPNASAMLSLASTYTTFGFTYQWQSSTVSNVGPFTSISGATLTNYVTPGLTTPTYYQVVVTCTNSNLSTTATVGQVSIQPTVIDNVPYYEDFEGIVNANDLPNCSWAASNTPNTTRTYINAQSQQRVARSGNKFASFYYFPGGDNYFYTNGINLVAGVTYSASVWFATNYYGDINWTDMSIMLGTTQTTTGLVTIATTGGPAASSSYKSLSNTFSVATSGVYYVAIKGSSSNGCCAYHLNFDDLAIEIPCALNSPSMSLTTNTTTICEGDAINFTASGADSYAWAHGPTTGAIVENPTQSGMYTVVGTNTASGCTSTIQQYITVLPKPMVGIMADKFSVCSGKPVNMSASGAVSYIWSTNSNANFITVNPTSSQSYTLLGTGANGCIGQAVQAINVLSLPNVTASSDRPEICQGESATLTGGGASTYQWASNSIFVQSGNAIVSPNITTTFTLTGTDANGCSNSVTFVQSVSECVGIQSLSSNNGEFRIYPNPNAGVFTVEIKNNTNASVDITDITGRTIMTVKLIGNSANVDITNLSNGIYYVRSTGNAGTDVIKVIKN